MPVHDWTRVDDGIFHAFHLAWLAELQKALNAGRLPAGYYALAEQDAGSVGPDVLTLQGNGLAAEEPTLDDSGSSGGTLTLVRTLPQTRFTTPLTIPDYVSRRRTLVIRHVSGNRIVALLWRSSPLVIRPAITPSAPLLRRRSAWWPAATICCSSICIRRRRAIRQGIHAVIGGELGGPPFTPPAGQPLTVASYEAVRPRGIAHVDTLAVGDPLPEAPLYLEPGGHVRVPLEATYREAYSGVPLRWRRVLEEATPHP